MIFCVWIVASIEHQRHFAPATEENYELYIRIPKAGGKPWDWTRLGKPGKRQNEQRDGVCVENRALFRDAASRAD